MQTINSLVPEFGGDEEESSFENAHCRCYGNSVKVFESDLSHHVLINFKCDFKNVSLLRLSEEKEHGFCFMGCRRNEYHPTFWIIQIILEIKLLIQYILENNYILVSQNIIPREIEKVFKNFSNDEIWFTLAQFRPVS